MLRIPVLIFSFLFFVFSSHVSAGDIPDITGTWTGDSQVYSTNHNYRQGTATTLEIKKQEGNLFEGVKSYFNPLDNKTHSEHFSGSITPDGRILIAEHEDGYKLGQLQEDGSLILQYAECGSTSDEPKVAYYHLKRKD